MESLADEQDMNPLEAAEMASLAATRSSLLLGTEENQGIDLDSKLRREVKEPERLYRDRRRGGRTQVAQLVEKLAIRPYGKITGQGRHCCPKRLGNLTGKGLYYLLLDGVEVEEKDGEYRRKRRVYMIRSSGLVGKYISFEIVRFAKNRYNQEKGLYRRQRDGQAHENLRSRSWVLDSHVSFGLPNDSTLCMVEAHLCKVPN